jgi:hypothetical protein
MDLAPQPVIEFRDVLYRLTSGHEILRGLTLAVKPGRFCCSAGVAPENYGAQISQSPV